MTTSIQCAPRDRTGSRPVALQRLAFALLFAPCAVTQASTLTVSVDDGVAPVADAVVSLHSPLAAAAVVPARALIDQIGSQFVPRVLAVQRGTAVTFPNSDKVRHHVYSFSQAKRFELPLYAGSPAAPVVFDTPGLAALGCNIHDWMVAYVLVLDTPYFAKSDSSGVAAIAAPPGDYLLRVWHERLGDEPASFERRITLSDAVSSDRVSLAFPPAAARAPARAMPPIAAAEHSAARAP